MPEELPGSIHSSRRLIETSRQLISRSQTIFDRMEAIRWAAEEAIGRMQQQPLTKFCKVAADEVQS
jgi:hypothetical protein